MPFDGFIPPTKNYFPMPNNWIDICAEIDSLAELKVVQYVLRHTWGYREYGVKKVITTDEFMHGRKRANGTRMDKGTGLSNRSVIDGLRAAEEHGYLESDLDDADKARKAKSYALKMQSDVKNVHIDTDNSDVKNVHISYEETTHLSEDTSYQPEDTSYRSEKDTIERHLGNTPKKESTYVGSSDEEANVPPIDLQEEKKKRDTDPRLKAVKIIPEQQTISSLSPSAQVSSAVSPNGGKPGAGENPPMALTARAIKAQAEKREKELWAIIEVERHTTYTATQRKLYENKQGIDCLIADDISDETLRTMLQAMDDFHRRTFTVLKFYGWMPNLSAKAPTPITNGKQQPPSNGIDHERNKRYSEELQRRFEENGPRLKGLKLRHAQ